MKYYLIVGEASGDLHASGLMRSLQCEDPEAEFRFFGGDLMTAVGGTRVRHYKELAYMGFVPVLLHLPTIFRNMRQCKRDIHEWQPDVVILVDYPGFNLSIAKYVHRHKLAKVFYYISPKIWAWKEWRIRDIKRNVDQLFSILPFEVPFFEQKHHYPIHYVGNPTVEEVNSFRKTWPMERDSFYRHNTLSEERPLLALLCGSRKQEIKDNLPAMLAATDSLADRYTVVVAGMSTVGNDYYRPFLEGHNVKLILDQTYGLLCEATAALVTSGTATLETALLRVPQVVCYYMKAGRLASLAKRLFIKVPYISLVNLICGEEVVPELVAEQMNVSSVRHHLASILPGGSARQAQLEGYERMAAILGEPGAPERAAKLILDFTKR